MIITMKNETNIESKKNILDLQYNSIINHMGDDWDFFLYIAEYVKFIKENYIFEKSLISNENYKTDDIKIEIYKEKALRELLKIKDKILKIAKKDKISIKEIDYLKKCKESDIESLYYHIVETIQVIDDKFNKDLRITISSKPISIEGETFKITTQTLSEAYDLYVREKEKTEREKEIQDQKRKNISNIWEEIESVYFLIFDPDTLYKKIIYKPNVLFGMESFLKSKREMGKIKNGLLNSDLFQRKRYLDGVIKIHRYILTNFFQNPKTNENYPQSIYLVTEKLENFNDIFMVVNECYEYPIRFRAKNKKGEETSARKLYNIAYILNVSGKMVPYNKKLANNINNGLFKNKRLSSFFKKNNLKKPTLVVKSERDKEILVLKNETFVKTKLIKDMPPQFQSIYIDKTI